MFLTVPLIFRFEKVTTLELREHEADEVRLLIESEHPLALERTKAEVKLSERSKLVEKVVDAVRKMVYWELVLRAVLGDTEDELTMKLTWQRMEGTTTRNKNNRESDRMIVRLLSNNTTHTVYGEKTSSPEITVFHHPSSKPVPLLPQLSMGKTKQANLFLENPSSLTPHHSLEPSPSEPV